MKFTDSSGFKSQYWHPPKSYKYSVTDGGSQLLGQFKNFARDARRFHFFPMFYVRFERSQLVFLVLKCVFGKPVQPFWPLKTSDFLQWCEQPWTLVNLQANPTLMWSVGRVLTRAGLELSPVRMFRLLVGIFDNSSPILSPPHMENQFGSEHVNYVIKMLYLIPGV